MLLAREKDVFGKENLRLAIWAYHVELVDPAVHDITTSEFVVSRIGCSTPGRVTRLAGRHLICTLSS